MLDLQGRVVSDKVYDYGARDIMLYALSTGFGSTDDPRELLFTTERQLRVSPTFLTTAIWDDQWLAEVGLDLGKVVHGEQRVVVHGTLPTTARLRGIVTVESIHDKGAEKGAVLYVHTAIHDVAHDLPLADLHSTILARGNGGFGGQAGRTPDMAAVPDRSPDMSVSQTTLPQQALLYRLNGDGNPLHFDADFARNAGFDRPILHGLCSFGIAAAALQKSICDFDMQTLRSFGCRFTAPTFPGETLITDIWQDGTSINFQTRTSARAGIVLDRGFATLA